jgi:hypothetical protein
MRTDHIEGLNANATRREWKEYYHDILEGSSV